MNKTRYPQLPRKLSPAKNQRQLVSRYSTSRHSPNNGSTAKIVIFFVIVIVIASVGAAISGLFNNTSANLADSPNTNQAKTVVADGSPVELSILSLGDVMLHYPDQVQYDQDGNPVFDDYFMYTKDIIQAADLALCNIEAPFGGGIPSGYPIFNMADEMAPAVKEAGIDVVYTTNNHMLDQHSDGVLRTVEVLRSNQLLATGSKLSPDEPSYVIFETKGIKIAVIAYTYETVPLDGLRGINGLPMSAEMDPLINSYSSGSAADKEELKGLIESSRSAGANLVICYFHNGDEDSQEISDEQKEMAQFVVDNGANIVFSSHPHVVQSMELLSPHNGGSPVPVFWAMGNYVSNQRIEMDSSPKNEQGIIAQVKLTCIPGSNQVTALTMDYVPLWVDRYNNGQRTVHTVIPEVGDVSTNTSIQASGHLERALNGFIDIHNVLGQSISWSK